MTGWDGIVRRDDTARPQPTQQVAQGPGRLLRCEVAKHVRNDGHIGRPDASGHLRI